MVYLRATIKEIHLGKERSFVVLRFDDSRAKGELAVEISDAETLRVGNTVPVTIEFPQM
jgi:hypothetical protein